MPTEKKPVAYFFTEQNAITQGAAQAFGPVSGNETGEFRLTAKFNCSSPSKAYSICKGRILVQPQAGNSTKVNLVLRPYTQPYPGLKVKYFVYRGLRKSDFFTNNADPLVIAAGNNNTTSEFINKVNSDFDSFYSIQLRDVNGNVIPKPAFAAKFIGYNNSMSDATLLSAVFLKESLFTGSGTNVQESDPFELPLLDAGKWLGNFEPGECGIDVVLDYGDYRHDFDNGEFVFDLGYARAAGVSVSATGTGYELKIKKEQVTQFIDIAAFYGLYAANGIVKLYSGGASADKEGAGIYTDVLTGFDTKNRWYIYIQSDRTRSYNFYGNYLVDPAAADSFKKGETLAGIAPAEYHYSGWPLLVNIQQQPVGDGKNRLYLQLVTDNNNDVALYCHLGIIENAQHNGFCNADDLRLPPDPQGNYSNLTRVINLAVPASTDGKNIAGVTQLLYEGVSYSYIVGQVQDNNQQPVNVYAQPDFFDDVFDLIKVQTGLTNSGVPAIRKLTSEKLNLVNHYYRKQQQGITAVGTVMVEDFIATDDSNAPLLQRVTYVTMEVNAMANALSAGEVMSVMTGSETTGKSVGESKTYELPAPFHYELEYFTDVATTITGMILKTANDTIPNKIILGITKAENDLLKATIGASTKNPRLFLYELSRDNTGTRPSEDPVFSKYNVGIVAEVNGLLKFLAPASPVVVYSLDNRYHVSAGYSKYVKEYAAPGNQIAEEKLFV